MKKLCMSGYTSRKVRFDDMIPLLKKINELVDAVNKLVNPEPLEIKIKYFDNELEKIKKINVGDWIDLRSAQTLDMRDGEYHLIPLGVGMILPEGYEAIVAPRSSTPSKFNIIMANSIGVIDNSYSGDNDQWYFPAVALRDTHIEKGDRICQFRIIKNMEPVKIKEVANLNSTSRGGIGSTGGR